jgi:4-methyl-5(b-hydroxyethyl)-thiazole monophosphate biosynthesis
VTLILNDMKKVLCFLYDTYVDFEIALACYYVNEDQRYQLTYISYERTPVSSRAGMKVYPDMTVEEAIKVDDIEGLIIPGGHERPFKPELKQLIAKLNNKGKLLAAICAGPEFLAKSGIFNSKKFTTTMTPEEYKEKKEADPFPRENYIEKRMVKDNNIVTAKGSAFVDFALEIFEWFKLYDNDAEREECKVMWTPE